MKMMRVLFLFSVFLVVSCSNSIEFTEEFMSETSGKYLYNADEIITIYYKENTLYLNWKGVETEPVVLEENVFFVPDLYQKLHFVKNPETGKRYLSIISESDPNDISYDYLKMPDDFKTPSMHLNSGNYREALKGYQAIKEKDSTSPIINEWDINNLGYTFLRDKKYDDAIAVFELNTKLRPNSYNVFDSLAEAYLKSGDSLNAYDNFKLAYKANPRSKRALRFIEQYESK